MTSLPTVPSLDWIMELTDDEFDAMVELGQLEYELELELEPSNEPQPEPHVEPQSEPELNINTITNHTAATPFISF